MKPSGIEWIGDIPSDWEVSNIGGMYTVRNQKVSDRDYPPLSVTKQGVLPQLDFVAKPMLMMTENSSKRAISLSTVVLTVVVLVVYLNTTARYL